MTLEVFVEVTKVIRTVIVLSAFIPLTLFVYYYGTEPWRGHRFIRQPSKKWKSTSIGKVLMTQKIMWVLMLAFIVTSLIFEYQPWESIVGVLAYVALVGMFWAVFAVLRHIQKSPPIPTDNGESGVADEKHPRTAGLFVVTPDGESLERKE